MGNKYNKATVLIKQCTNVQLRHVVIEKSHNSYGLVGINILGDSHFSYVTKNVLSIIYNDTIVDMENHSLSIDHYHINNVDRCFEQKVKFELKQHTYRVKIQIFYPSFQRLKNSIAISINFNSKSIGKNILLVKHCQFSNINMPFINSTLINMRVYKGQQDDSVWLQNYEFLNNQIPEGIVHVIAGPALHVSHCRFHHNDYSQVLRRRRYDYNLMIKIIITNTTFSSSTHRIDHDFVMLYSVNLYLQGPVIFYNIGNVENIILLHNGTITLSNHTEFVNITAGRAILYNAFFLSGYETIHVFVTEGTIINITHCKLQTFAHSEESAMSYGTRDYPYRYFQYLSDTKSSSKGKYGNYSIRFDNNAERLTPNLHTKIFLLFTVDQGRS